MSDGALCHKNEKVLTIVSKRCVKIAVSAFRDLFIFSQCEPSKIFLPKCYTLFLLLDSANEMCIIYDFSVQ